MKINDFLAQATGTLQQAGISTARLDVLVLLEDILNTNRTQILAEAEYILTEVELNSLMRLVQKRAQHVPLAYLRGKTEFYGREFVVNEHVLEPRPEYETMIDIYKTLKLPAGANVADVGCGSGALGITAALEKSEATVTLIEIDASALAVAKQNAGLHKTDVRLLQSDLLTGADEQFDVLLCNLPYVPDDFHINTAAGHEPELAIFGGPDGLDIYRQLFDQLAAGRSRPDYVLTESLPTQHGALENIANDAGYRATREDDFIRLFQPL
jgi:release factor glutamine methyltransferase